ncbi:hypothetical protein [Thalassobellus suaedae]|uniref:50S ribosomal protein L29 n=1 Tax=Thalassobellus suaedae TaxID=3074124 RepID=A0ABY9XXG6_9FLAO|nr:hypothetical protein RHP51_07810 [Flavobacteriaceae bacterium HL-DH14]
MSKKEDLLKELDGIENTIWAYKIEFHDIDNEVRLSTIDAFEKKKKLIEAKIKAIDLKKKLSKD